MCSPIKFNYKIILDLLPSLFHLFHWNKTFYYYFWMHVHMIFYIHFGFEHCNFNCRCVQTVLYLLTPIQRTLPRTTLTWNWHPTGQIWSRNAETVLQCMLLCICALLQTTAILCRRQQTWSSCTPTILISQLRKCWSSRGGIRIFTVAGQVSM